MLVSLATLVSLAQVLVSVLLTVVADVVLTLAWVLVSVVLTLVVLLEALAVLVPILVAEVSAYELWLLRFAACSQVADADAVQTAVAATKLKATATLSHA